MLRPATPLAVLLFAAFALLTLATISTPIIKQIPLSSFKIKDVGDLSFGVFGYCTSSGCSPIEIGYDTSAFSDDKINSDFDIPRATRSTLSSILIVHPVAALITLINFVLAIVAHFHSPSHSARYLLILFIVSVIDFIVCLLCFLVDVLLFIPHLSWGSYIVVAATILVAFCSLVTCAMRRTLVNRKANRKRIAQNAEMSGENYYNRQAQTAPVTQVTGPQPTAPMISGANGGGDKLPEFTTFEKKDDRSEERIPLTSASPIDRPPATLVNDSTPPSLMDGAPSRSPYSTPVGRDQYGNPLPPQDGYAMRNGPQNERMNSRGRGGMPPGGYRGRGGFAGPGRGGGPPPNGRGGYGPPGRGRGGYGPPPRGYGGPGPRGGRGPPPQGYQSGPDRRPSPGAPYGPGPGVGAYGPSQPSPYGSRQQSPGPQFAPGYGNPEQPGPQYSAYNPRRASLPRAESPPPLPGIDDDVPGPAVELDASPINPGVGQYGIRDSDSDVAGMLAMQQARVPGSDHGNNANCYSQEGPTDVYVPPRQAWNQGPGRSSPGLAPPAARGPARPISEAVTASVASDYYEDVDPRFSEPSAPAATDRKPPPVSMQPLPASNSYDDFPNRARSPAESERSNFTSISQRGINPRWNPANAPMPPPVAGGYGGGGGGNVVPRRPVNRPAAGPADASDLLLNSNPDFQLPGRGGNIPRAAGPR